MAISKQFRSGESLGYTASEATVLNFKREIHAHIREGNDLTLSRPSAIIVRAPPGQVFKRTPNSIQFNSFMSIGPCGHDIQAKQIN